MDRHEITERTLPFLLRRLHDAGISATPHVDSHTGDIYLKVDGWRRINVENLIDELTQTDPSKHEVTIERWVAFIMESGRIAEQSVTDPDELRQRVRTRIIPANLAANPHLSYARPFPGGLALALCLDFPNTVTTVSNGHLEKYPLSLDELYHWGQINTDNEAIDEHTTCGPFTGIAGESLFIASKAAHIASLVSTLHIDAPHGLLFAIPDRSVLLYAPADPTSPTHQFVSLVDYLRIDILQRLHTMPARILSKDLFYCSPNGTFGAITRSGHPDVQELFTNPDLDADRFTELALTYMTFFEGYHMRFYPPNM
nr:hypothetical protein [uncultured Actinomyces sp.]